MLSKIVGQILFLSLLINGNINAQTIKSDYLIAYNVLLNDTFNKDNYEVFTMNLDGSDNKNITNLKGVEWTYYAYKNRLFYISDKDTCHRCYFLYEMDINGSNKRKVSNLRIEDSWMSARNDGDELIVSGRVGNSIRYQLFIINTRTGEFRQITNDTAAAFTDPAFSPNGKQIVFAYCRDKRDTTAYSELYIMNVDGSNIKQLTYYPKDDPSFKSHNYKAGTARWYPDGSFITYISHQKGQNNIYCVTPDGKKNWRLTTNKQSEGWYDWSDDGRLLVFQSENKTGHQYDIYLMNWTSKNIMQLTNSQYRIQQAPVFVKK